MTNPFYIDLRSLALVRVCLGLILIADLLIRSSDLGIWLTDAGVLPNSFIVPRTSEWRFSLYFLHGSWAWAALLTSLQALASVCLLMGWRTRISTVVVLILLISLHNRQPVLLQGGDNLLLLLIFWSLFLPMAARWSVDTALSREGITENRYVSAGSAGILLQAMSVYFFSAFLKSGPQWLPEGTAIYYALHLDQFATWLAPLWRDMHWLTKPLTYYVWWLELIGPLLIFLPFWNTWMRAIGVFAFVSLEIAFIANLNIGLFPFISTTSILLFLPSAFWDAIERKSIRSAPEIFFDGDCAFCEKTCALLRTMLIIPKATIRPAQADSEARAYMDAHYSWVVRDGEGLHIKSTAMAALFKASPVLFWLAPLVRGTSALLDPVYDWVGRNRLLFGRVTALAMPWRRQLPMPGLPSHIVASLFIVLLGWWNITTVTPYTFAKPIGYFKDSLRLDQIWNMFAPYPSREDGWFVMPGGLENGAAVDVLHRQPGAPDFDKPADFQKTQFKNYRWRKYLSRLWLKRYRDYRLPYARWQCRSWNAERAPGERLETFEIYFVEEHTPPPGAAFELQRHRIWQHRCLDAS